MKPALADQASVNDLSVATGKSVMLDFVTPVKKVSIGQNEVAEVRVMSPNEVILNGKAPGQTSLIVWDRSGERQFFNVIVRTGAWETNERLEAVRRQINLELPGQQVNVTWDNGSVFLRGTVRDLASSDRAVQIASTALPPSDPGGKSGSGKVVNLLYVSVPPADKQIMLKVRFASVDRSKARQLGINLFDLGQGNAIGGITTQQFSPPSIGASTGTSSSTTTALGSGSGTATFSTEGSILAFFPGLNAGADIQALETKGVVQTLAQPNVIAESGKQASFLAGGEFPYPVVQGTSGGSTAVTIMFREYGIRLNFIPTITPRGTIRLQVAPEVSALDYANEVEISGFEVPGITTRKVNTEVELANKQSFMIGGLLDKSTTDTFQKIPFLGDIPVLGKFFQSESRTKNDSELIVIVTPEIVDPIPAGSPLPSLKFPVPFMPQNTAGLLDDSKTGNAADVQQRSTVPVEEMIELQKPEKPLVIGGGGFTDKGSDGK